MLEPSAPNSECRPPKSFQAARLDRYSVEIKSCEKQLKVSTKKRIGNARSPDGESEEPLPEESHIGCCSADTEQQPINVRCFLIVHYHRENFPGTPKPPGF
nr:hypothetical protein [Methylobacterium sp. L1A1]